MAEQEICPHLDSIGEVTKEDLLQKSKVRVIFFHSSQFHSPFSSDHVVLILLQGTCQSCGAGGPNLWACLQVRSKIKHKKSVSAACAPCYLNDDLASTATSAFKIKGPAEHSIINDEVQH